MNSSGTVAIKYGLIVSGLLIAFFLILKIFGLHNNPWFRLFNGVITAFGIYSAIKEYKKNNSDAFDYTNGFKTGLMTGFLATFIFAIFMGIYMFHLDVAFMDHLLKDWFHDYNHGGGILIFIILIEGLASTAVLTLTFMQIFKNSGNSPQKK